MSEERRRRQFQKRVLAVMEKAKAEGKLQPGNVYEIPVRHDAWCALLKGRGYCNCDPDIRPPERVPSPLEN